MGLGSRLSKLITHNLIRNFLILEACLSILVAFSSVLVYTLAAVSQYYGIVIYSLSMVIGLLIGLEIPLVVRINKEYEDLKSNISSILEKDYYGCLAGGVFFAFIGLPILGLSYTPFVLGIINFLVAIIVLFRFKDKIKTNQLRRLKGGLTIVFVVLMTGIIFTKPIIQWGEQKKIQRQNRLL